MHSAKENQYMCVAMHWTIKRNSYEMTTSFFLHSSVLPDLFLIVWIIISWAITIVIELVGSYLIVVPVPEAPRPHQGSPPACRVCLNIHHYEKCRSSVCGVWTSAEDWKSGYLCLSSVILTVHCLMSLASHPTLWVDWLICVFGCPAAHVRVQHTRW